MIIHTTYYDFNEVMNKGSKLEVEHAINGCNIDKGQIREKINAFKEMLASSSEYESALKVRLLELNSKAP